MMTLRYFTVERLRHGIPPVLSWVKSVMDMVCFPLKKDGPGRVVVATVITFPVVYIARIVEP